MRILYALNTFRPHIDGVSISIERQATGMADRGHSVAIVAPSPTFTNYVETGQRYCLYRLRAIPVHTSRRLLPLLSRRGVEWALRDFRPDAVVVSVPFLLSRTVGDVARVRGYPVVGITSMMPEWFYYNLVPLRPVTRFLNGSLWRLITDYYNRCDHVVGVTATALKFLSDHGLRRPASVISNGVPLDVFHPRPRDERLARSLGIPKKPTVLYLGRLDAEKCMDVWVQAIPRVLQKIDAHFIIGGDGTERTMLERMVRDLGVAPFVSFVGFRSDDEYPSVFSLADVFAISSPVELQSIVTLEAAASGLPIVAASAGALPELVQDGVNGRLFAASDAGGMADAIVDVLADAPRRQGMGVAARLIATQHDICASLNRYEDVYERVVGQRVVVPRRAAHVLG
jgi:1,2-diacylglycerol 3-alpha-glucosyltransferase